MLRIEGRSTGHFCDGLPRRSFLRVGALAMGGLALPGVLRAQALGTPASVRTGRSHKAIIMIFLPGGPPHQDMWDLKPDAPSDIRGEFEPIKTNVPGIEIGEMFPRLAGMMDQCAIVRSIVGATGDHYAFQCLTGRVHQRQPRGGWPCLGAAVGKLLGPADPGVPAAVGLSPRMGHKPWADNGGGGFLGPAYAPFAPSDERIQNDMVLRDVSLDRLRDRRQLMRSFDQFRRDVDASGMMGGMDAFSAQAMGVLTDSKLAEALDVSREDPRLRERYGKGVPDLKDDGGPRLLDQFLVARRLVSAGARVVTLGFSRWDWHQRNFPQARQEMPMLDQGVSALIEDLRARGMDKDVAVIVWGEFGRTPRINKEGGRDHWPAVNSALLACGGLRTGQVIGSTDRLGGEVRDRPVHFQEIFATLYHTMGIDAAAATLDDLSGRPTTLVDSQYKALPELV